MLGFFKIGRFKKLELNAGNAKVMIRKSYYKEPLGDEMSQNIFVRFLDGKKSDMSSCIQETGDNLKIDISKAAIVEINLYLFMDVPYEFDVTTTGEVYILDGITPVKVSILPELKIVKVFKRFGINLSKVFKRKPRLKW